MAMSTPLIGTTPIDDHETVRGAVDVARTARGLLLAGLSPTEASNLAAHLAGLPPAGTGWTVRQVEHLLFLRSIVETGRLAP